MRYCHVLVLNVFLLALSPLAMCQNRLSDQPCPDLAVETLGCELIAWSDLQQPVPPPDTAPTPENPTDVAVLVGTVERIAGGFSLRVSASSAVSLDQMATAQRYEGRRVKVTGVLSAEGKTLRVERIVPLQ